MCAKVEVVWSNCLAKTNPEFANLWHPTKNGKITPFDVTNGTKKLFWWKCPEGDNHEWQASPKNMSKCLAEWCVVCSGKLITKNTNLAYKYPDVAKKFHHLKNHITPDKIHYKSTKRFFWKCDIDQNHKWEATIPSILNGKNCTTCEKQKNSLAIFSPKLAREWHPLENGSLTPFDVSKSSYKKVWWMCINDNNHKWLATVESRHKRAWILSRM